MKKTIIIKGHIRSGSRALNGMLIEAFDAPVEFQNSLPLTKRQDLTRHSLRRLGSAITNPAGEFEIEYCPDISKYTWRNRSNINVWVVASSCLKDGEDIEMVYQSCDVREHAGAIEYYPIYLAEDYIDNNNKLTSQSTRPTPETLAVSYATRQSLETAALAISTDKFEKRLVVRRDFDDKIAPKIRTEFSLVELNKDGEPLDPDYVKPDESVQAKAEKRMLTALAKNFDVDSSDKLVLSGRILLTAAQIKQLELSPNTNVDNNTITVDEEELDKVLKKSAASGKNPESGSQIVNRVNAIKHYCQEVTNGEKCLFDKSKKENPTNGNGTINNVDEESPIDSPQTSDGQNLAGNGITVDELKGNIPLYIANILEESSILDTGIAALPSPGSQLSESDINNNNSFPSLTLPPSPADVPAFHDFYDLQIAFKPVWTEALDENLIDNIGKYYEFYVENGGNQQAFIDTISDPTCPIISTGHYNFISVPDAQVQKHIDITNQEWTALTTEQKEELRNLAQDIQKNFDLLNEDKLENNNFFNGVTSTDLNIYNNTKEYVHSKVNDLQEQAERIVSSARVEIEQQVANKSIVPNNRILNQLIQRANAAYPAKYFAANKRQRSVNFGVLVNYRQRWTPTAYQVGELIKSIPLAPKEVRKYSKKIVKKEKRARKEIESNIQSLKRETNSTVRAEADIIQKAMEKTNFNASTQGTFTIGVWSGTGSSGLTEDVENQSSENKKSFHEAVVKAAREYKNEHKVELETESTFESEFQESGEIMNPNDELTVTYLFYELQRRYRVEERLHRLTSVVLVAQEMPCPGDIDEDWLIAHRWILNRVLLDDSFKQPLFYVAEGQVAEEFALQELRKTLAQQRRLVEELKEDVSDSRALTESRYAALQRSMERTARAAQRKSKSGGILGFARKLTSTSVVGDFVDNFIGGAGESPEAARVREAATQDAYQRELQKLRDQEAQLAQLGTSLERATEDYTNRLAGHLANVVLVTELKNHVKDNIVHYMQAIWMHEPFQQRWLRLKDVPVPVLKRAKRSYTITKDPQIGSLANVAHLGAKVHDFKATGEVLLPPERENGKMETVPLYQIADIDGLLGFRANYMIFPMKKANAITDFMMEPYVEKASGGYGLTDPDELGNISLDEFSDYVCCLKERLTAEEFEELKSELRAQLKKLLQSPLRDDEEIVVPLDAMYIEALPGATPILENFKLLHRQIDAADAQEDLRLKKMEKLRYAKRLLSDQLDDPETEAKYVFEGNGGTVIVPPNNGEDNA